MRRSSSGEKKITICVPVIENTIEDALRAVKRASGVADLIELRADYLEKPELPALLHGKKKPFIVTHRRSQEGGRYRGDEKKRIQLLKGAIDLGVAYVDVEVKTDRALLQDLIEKRNGTKLVLSSHNLHATPSLKALRELLARMRRWGPDVVKIVTLARSWEDNLKVLSLISYALKRDQKIVAFCMGDRGKMSRIFSPLMGAAWAYAALNRKRASAPGQLTAEGMRDVWRKLE